jgi:hypothetical protein
VRVAKKSHNASFFIGNNVFAFARPEGVVIKLPRERIKELVEERNASPLVMGKGVRKNGCSSGTTIRIDIEKIWACSKKR